jgi:hypothetical protein
VIETRWAASAGREHRRLEASLDGLDDQERALRDLIAATAGESAAGSNPSLAGIFQAGQRMDRRPCCWV